MKSTIRSLAGLVLAAGALAAGVGVAPNTPTAHGLGLDLIEVVHTGDTPASASTVVSVTCPDFNDANPHTEQVTVTGSGTVTAPCVPTHAVGSGVSGDWDSAAIEFAAPDSSEPITSHYVPTVGALPTAPTTNADGDNVWTIPVVWTGHSNGVSAFGPATSTIETSGEGIFIPGGNSTGSTLPGTVGFDLAADGTVTLVADYAVAAWQPVGALGPVSWSVTWAWQPTFAAAADPMVGLPNAGPAASGTDPLTMVGYDGATFNAGLPADHPGETLTVHVSVVPVRIDFSAAIAGEVYTYSPHQVMPAAPPATGSIQTFSPLCDDQSVLSGRLVEVRDASGTVIASGVAGGTFTDIPVGDYTVFVADGEGGFLAGQAVSVTDGGTANVAAQTDGSPSCVVAETTTTVAETTTTTVPVAECSILTVHVIGADGLPSQAGMVSIFGGAVLPWAVDTTGTDGWTLNLAGIPAGTYQLQHTTATGTAYGPAVAIVLPTTGCTVNLDDTKTGPVVTGPVTGPVTGGDAGPLVLAGLALLAGGGALILITRRRKPIA